MRIIRSKAAASSKTLGGVFFLFDFVFLLSTNKKSWKTKSCVFVEWYPL